jgi:hypothetical protein
MLKLTWSQAAAWRAGRNFLDQRAPARDMLKVISRICGLHAQLMSAAELSLWTRVDGLKSGTVQQALWDHRTLVKTWAMRGTLHLLPSRELPLWHAALSTNPRYLRPALWKRNFGITLNELDRLTEAIAEALRGRLMTREELADEVGRITGSHELRIKLAKSSWGTALKPAAFTGALCFGPSLGQRVRFTRPDTWVEISRKRIDPQAAKIELARRFLSAYGPASHQDLARWWGGGGVSSARKWISALEDEVTEVDLDGKQVWMLSSDTRKMSAFEPKRTVRLLAAFDHYVVAASLHARQLLPGDLRARVYRPQGWISPVLLVDGRMLGTWRHRIKGSSVEVVLEPFVKLPRWARQAAAHEAERLADFLGGVLSLTSKQL